MPKDELDSSGDDWERFQWGRFLNQPVSNAFLALFRISLGACLVWQIWWYFSSDLIRNYYIDPPFHFTWYLLDWIKPWPGNGMYAHFFVLTVAAMCIMLGFYYRIATWVFFIGYTHVFFIDRCWYLNHYYLIVLISFCTLFLPAHHRLSLDAWRKPSLRTDVAPAWTLWLLRAQVGIPYFFGGVAKLNVDWLRGEPIRTWLASSTDFPLIGQWFTEEWCVAVFVYGGIFIDLLAVPLMLFRRTRIVAMTIVMVFHLMNARLFHIGVFPWMMIALTLLIFTNPSLWERLLPKVAHPVSPTRGLPKVAACLLLGFLAVQLVAPLRHWLYPGSVAFTREGHCFSWRMKLNIRGVHVQYFTASPDEVDRKPIRLARYVTGPQERKIRDPDMILQLAHHLSRELTEPTPVNEGEDPEIFANATVALNGRPPSIYVDSTRNLAEVPRTLWHADWIYESPQRQVAETQETPAGKAGAAKE